MTEPSHQPVAVSPLRLLALELPVTALLCVALWMLTGSEIAWVLAGVLGGWLASLAFRLRGRAPRPNARVRKTGQFLIGIAIGPTLVAQNMAEVMPHLATLVTLVALTLAAAVAIGLGYARVFRVDRLTAGLSTLPGGIGVMASIAADRGRPPQFVALIQGLRVAAIVSLAPVLILLLEPERPDVARLPPLLIDPGSWILYVLALAGAGGAAWLAARLRVPVASLLGPMFFGVVLAIALSALTEGEVALHVPYLQEIVGQALLGITVGEYLARRVRASRAAFAGGFVSVAAGLIAAGSLAVGLHLLTGWSLLTCFLMASPGGAPEMIVLAAASGAELHLVVFTQILRQLAVNALIPLWLRIFDTPSGPEPAGPEDRRS